MKRFISIACVLALVLSALIFVPACDSFSDVVELSTDRPYVLGVEGEALNFANTFVTATFEDGRTEELSLDALRVSGGTRFNRSGIHNLTVRAGSASLAMYAVIRPQNDDRYELYSQNFLGLEELPDSWSITTDNSESVRLENNQLVLDGTYGDVNVQLPEFLAPFGELWIRAQVTVEGGQNSSYVGVTARDNNYLFRVQRASQRYGGVSLQKRENDRLNMLERTSLEDNLEDNRIYILEVRTLGDGIVANVGPDDVINSREILEVPNGTLGFEVSNMTMRISSVEVFMFAQEELPETFISDFVYVTNPETTIVAAPTIAGLPSNSDELGAMLAMDVSPASVLVNVDADLNVTTESGETLGTVDEFYETLDQQIIPIFGVADVAAATALATHLRSNHREDFFVLSEEPEAIREARRIHTMSRGIVDFRNNMPSELIEVRNIVNRNNGRIALLPYEVLTRENVEFFQRRALTVWGAADGENSDRVNLAHALTAGVNGVLTTNVEEAVNLFESFDAIETLVRRPLIIAHRANTTVRPENTVAALRFAMENGSDMIEMDIRMTADGHIIILHTDDLSRTHGTTPGQVFASRLTLEELLTGDLYANSGQGPQVEAAFPHERTATLSQFFEIIRGTEFVFFLEIKGQQAQGAELARMIEEYGVSENIVVISFMQGALLDVRARTPEVSLSLLAWPDELISRSNHPLKSLRRTLTTLQELNSQASPGIIQPSEFMNEFVGHASHRGVTLWTYTYENVGGSFTNDFLNGAAGLTIGTCVHSMDWVGTVVAENNNITLANGASQAMTATGVTYGRARSTLTQLDVQIIEGDDILSVDGSTITATGTGTAWIIVGYLQVIPGGRYVTYSQPIRVTIN